MRRYLLSMLLTAALPAMAEVRPLEDFYPSLDQAASVLQAEANLETQRFDLKAKEAQAGWELFGELSAGYLKNVFANEEFMRYVDRVARFGARLPLLGSAEKQERSIKEASVNVEAEEIRLRWSRHLARLALEDNYAAYWGARRMQAVAESYLALRESVAEFLARRTQTGLVLASDRFEFLSAFDQARYAASGFTATAAESLMRIGHLTGAEVDDFEAVKPTLIERADDRESLETHPELQLLHAQIGLLQHVIESEKWQGIESDFTVSQSANLATPVRRDDGIVYRDTETGYGTAASLNVRMPVDILSYRDAEKARLRSQLNGLMAQYKRRSQELGVDYRAAIGQADRLIEQVRFQETRLKAANEALRERYLRLQALDGDVLEKYVQAVNLYYRVAVDYLQTSTDHWKALIRLRLFLPNELAEPGRIVGTDDPLASLTAPLKQAKNALHPEGSDAVPGAHMPPIGVYVWNSREVLTSEGQEAFWRSSRTLHINRVLLSLDKEQIRAAARDPKTVQRFIATAHQHGIRVELLLGDPHWLLPELRPDLLAIIGDLAELRFDGLHLDIEPDQLEPKPPRPMLIDEWLETFRQAAIRSPWPVSASIHPRYLESDTSICIPCELEKAKIRELVVMYYVINYRKAADLMESIMRRYPGLRFGLAQSVEPVLDESESYATLPMPRFEQAMSYLSKHLKADNFGGLVIQSWQDLIRYADENPL